MTSTERVELLLLAAKAEANSVIYDSVSNYVAKGYVMPNLPRLLESVSTRSGSIPRLVDAGTDLRVVSPEVDTTTLVLAMSQVFCQMGVCPTEAKEAYSLVIQNARLLKSSMYKDNPYVRDIQVADSSYGKFRLLKQEDVPGECHFLRAGVTDSVGMNCPSVFFWVDSYTYPILLQDSVSWMSITPNEICTMKDSISKAQGNVLVLGMGLGYYPYMVSLKDTVTSVTVVELEHDVIELFKRDLLPQFKYANKIRVVEDDAFHYLKSADLSKFDYCFSDIIKGVEDFATHKRMYQALQSKDLVSYCWLEDAITAEVANVLMWVGFRKLLGETPPSICDFMIPGLAEDCIQYLNRNSVNNARELLCLARDAVALRKILS